MPIQKFKHLGQVEIDLKHKHKILYLTNKL